MTQVVTVFALALALLAPAAPALAQSSAEIQELRRSIDALRESQQRIERELGEIKTLLRSRPAAQAPPDDEPKNLVLTLDGPVKGDRTAKLALLDFTDYQ
ncbi:MAG: hypothetical protein HYR51_14240 [Candidatus Rokubacteria bacterium]|nr:hypothetical protein [Candidatus Rokubacteria bacterium]